MHLIGNFGDDDLITAARCILFRPFGAQPEPATTRLVGLEDRLARLDDDAAGREIRSRDHFDKFLDRGIGMLDEVQQRRTQFVQVVRRNVGRHANRNAGRAVGKQVWERGR